IPGAGWGVVDSAGRPKAAYWFLKRAWAPRSIHLTDEGLDGIAIHVVNDAATPIAARIELQMLQSGRLVTASGEARVSIEARGTVSLHADALAGGFMDSANAYRFGPPKHDVVIARLWD